MKPNVELIRVRHREAYCDGDIVRIVEEVRGLCIRFEDCSGRVVSLAFDGRADKDGDDERHGLYRDCPVMVVNRSSGPMNDLQTLRALRNALNSMDLGDSNDVA